MYLRTLETCVFKYRSFGPTKLFLAPGLAWQASWKKIKTKLGLLTNIDMLSLVEKGIRGGICLSINIQKLIINT